MASRRHIPRRSLRRSARIFGALSIAAATLAVPNIASAQSGCGEISVEFSNVRLLNNGVNNVAGPFNVDIPAGVYDVTLIGYDFHNEQPNVGTQPGEQFVVELNNGYVSPPSADIPDEVNSSTAVHRGQTISGAATTLTLRHLGVPGVNSVDPACVGFDLVAPIGGDAAADSSSDPADSSNDPVDSSTDPATTEPVCTAEAPGDNSSDSSDAGTDATVCPADDAEAAGDDATVCDATDAANTACLLYTSDAADE